MAAIQKTELDDVISHFIDMITKAHNLIEKDLPNAKYNVGSGTKTGEIECPMCGGVLDYIQTYNKHIHGICRTSGCLGFNE